MFLSGCFRSRWATNAASQITLQCWPHMAVKNIKLGCKGKRIHLGLSLHGKTEAARRRFRENIRSLLSQTSDTIRSQISYWKIENRSNFSHFKCISAIKCYASRPALILKCWRCKFQLANDTNAWHCCLTVSISEPAALAAASSTLTPEWWIPYQSLPIKRRFWLKVGLTELRGHIHIHQSGWIKVQSCHPA